MYKMSKTSTSQLTKSTVTLKGSAQIVTECFNYGINSILYQRGIYPPESFTRKQEYGLTMLVSTDEKVTGFISEILAQVKVRKMRNGGLKCLLKAITSL